MSNLKEYSCKPLATIALCIVTFLACSENSVGPDRNENEIEIYPEEAGWSQEKLEGVKDFAEQAGSAAVIALYDGQIFFSWGNVSENYRCQSIRKLFLGALYGIFINRNIIDTNSTLQQLNIDDIPPGLTQSEKQARIKDLLMSRSGVYHEAAAEAQWMIDTRPARGSHAPGEYFYYNNWDFNAACTIFEQKVGIGIFETFKTEIADLLGMEDFSTDLCFYNYENNKSIHPSYSFGMSARDMAKFGALYLKKGNWFGKQIIPENWITESTKTYSILFESVDWGYGMLCETYPYGSEGSFGHMGGAGHWILVLPEENLVIVHHVDYLNQNTFNGAHLIQIAEMILDARLDD
ncbi:serine hydrolase domain-containing protein [Bacteroidota bacterium]